MRLAAISFSIALAGACASNAAWAQTVDHADDSATDPTPVRLQATTDAPPEPSQQRESLWSGARRRVWYGAQTLAVDGMSNLLIGVGAATSGSNDAAVPGTLLALGIPTYELGAPIVHWAHGNVGTGFGSLGMRLLSTFVGVGVGAAAASALKGPALVAVGVLTVSIVEIPVVVDATMLAYDEQPNESKQSWIATIAPTKSGATIRLVGSF